MIKEFPHGAKEIRNRKMEANLSYHGGVVAQFTKSTTTISKWPKLKQAKD